ncbi:PREDICTED: WD repeat-containing protein 6 isoform X2 [Tarenaya hassleriana]|nr:PREDICTED: WD repeat-containing protein 6 isoform X2 [Tarenaya hassleriana]
MLRLTGHEGSIFRIVWSLDGSKLVSVSDDRSARIWEVDSVQNHADNWQEVVGPVLFGHSARVWDCCITDSLVITAGEDCTCRVWGLDGKQLEIVKEHIGRGIWRCLYDPSSSLLVTAGFDSAVKVHQLHNCGSGTFLGNTGARSSPEKMESLSVCLPNSTQHTGLMDSKSEYVRCLRFTQNDTMYVATNHGFLFHAKLLTSGNVKWAKLVRIPKEGPIICMDVMRGREMHKSCELDDWVVLGDGKGYMTIVRVVDDTYDPVVGLRQSWKAGPERQLLGTFWCNSLGFRYVFSSNPRGQLMLWKLTCPLASDSSDASGTSDISLLAEFSSSFGMRIMCLNASVEDEVLVCGDIRGNISLFPLPKSMLSNSSVSPELKISPTNYFKGAHGISTVSSLSVARLTYNKVEICSTGGDGCICYFEYDKERQALEFMGLKQVKELSLVQSICQNLSLANDQPNHEYAAGFASTDFLVWNITNETKVAQISCGGWRRPHSFYLGDIPEMNNCFGYVKDDVIHIHRQWVGKQDSKVYPQNLRMQFHGREIHSVCFISRDTKAGLEAEEWRSSNRSSWIATGCEDGTVRLTRFASDVENWSASELLGEHVGGSAVRSVCCVSKTHRSALDLTSLAGRGGEDSPDEDNGSPCLLISVGAKRVLTSWLLRNGRSNKREESSVHENGHSTASLESSPVTFQWLATDMPRKSSHPCGRSETPGKVPGVGGKDVLNSGSNSHQVREKYEDDWRYMAVTAFLVKCAGSRPTICFVVVACSDATLTLRALVLPHRLWFDVASLAPLTSPVLSLQHAVVPLCLLPEGDGPASNVYLVISGATDGSIAFWDVTKNVEAFVKQVSSLHIEKFIDCQKRPQTGRGSQGGRKWKFSGPNMSKQGQDNNLVGETSLEDSAVHSELTNGVPHESDVSKNGDSPPETSKVEPSHVVRRAHQSGVNCLHVSCSRSSQSHGNCFSFDVISGGDDQALHYLSFDIFDSGKKSETMMHTGQNQICSYRLRLIDHGVMTSAHSSAVKGVWMDGNWVFSTGLDQRIRCWHIDEDGKLTERAHVIISVPEPEALDARTCGENRYQIAVAGRGMQTVEFSS